LDGLIVNFLRPVHHGLFEILGGIVDEGGH
jgi:hypothetical protein